MIFIHNRPNEIRDLGHLLKPGYVGVMTPPQATEVWVIAEHIGRDEVREGAVARGVSPPDIEQVLTVAHDQRFGGIFNLEFEPDHIDLITFTPDGPKILYRVGDGYVGFAASIESPFYKVPAELRNDWYFTRPISEEEFARGMRARGHYPVDTADMINDAQRVGWAFGGCWLPRST